MTERTAHKLRLNGPILALLFILGLAAIDLAYLPALNSSLFFVDDNALIEAPQVTSEADWEGLKTIFSVGLSPDYYPIRDLSYLLDFQLFEKNWAKWKAHNLVLFNELILIVLFALILMGIPPALAVPASLVWGVHPIHAEMVGWLSARKDLLAFVYAGYAFLCFHFAVKRSSNRFFLLSFLFFGLSLFSKASFCLLPILLLFYPVRQKIWSWVLVLTGLAAAAFQSWFYSNVTDMGFPYGWKVRFQAALAAFGKYWGGLIFSSWNVVNTDNYGDWLANNQGLIVPGFFIFALLSTLALYYFYKRKKIYFLPLAGFFILYLPTSGILFPHRNFYSVRYFEVPLLLLYIGVIYAIYQVWLAENKKALLATTLMLTALYLGFLPLAQEEGYVWTETSSVYRKASQDQPRSILLKGILYQSLLDDYNRENSDHWLLRPIIENLETELANACEKTDQNLSSCINFLVKRYDAASPQNPKLVAERLGRYKKALELAWPSQNWGRYYDLMAELKTGVVPDSKKMEEWRKSLRYVQTSYPRGTYWATECFLKGPAAANAVLEDYYRRHLLNRGDITLFLSINVHPKLRATLNKCI